MISTDQLVADYLKRLKKELRGLPRSRRREIVDEISEHIDEARSGGEAQSEVEVRTLLDRLGDPADIAADARERFGIGPTQSGAAETAALILLPIGGLVVPVVGWIVGVVLLWASQVWTTRDKLIGTLVPPGGLALPVYLFFFVGAAGGGETCISGGTIVRGAGGVHHVIQQQATCSGGLPTFETVLLIVLLAILVISPFVTAVYLARRTRRRSDTGAGWGEPSTAT